jgi:hypothetical protein
MTPPVLNVLTTVMSSLVRAELPAPCTWLSRYIFVLLKKKSPCPLRHLFPAIRTFIFLQKVSIQPQQTIMHSAMDIHIYVEMPARKVLL